MKNALRIICLFTVLASVYLSLSVLILQPPGADFRTWFPVAALFVAQGVLTLVATSRRATGPLGWLVAAGGCAVALVGGSWAASTVSGPHFEGYALLLATGLVVQGTLTVLVFLRTRPASPSF